MDQANRKTATGVGKTADTGQTRIVWSMFRMSGFLRRSTSESGKSVATLTRAEVLSLETRLRAIVGQA